MIICYFILNDTLTRTPCIHILQWRPV